MSNPKRSDTDIRRTWRNFPSYGGPRSCEPSASRTYVLPDALTCLLAMTSQVQILSCGPALCMRVLPRKKPV